MWVSTLDGDRSMLAHPRLAHRAAMLGSALPEHTGCRGVRGRCSWLCSGGSECSRLEFDGGVMAVLGRDAALRCATRARSCAEDEGGVLMDSNIEKAAAALAWIRPARFLNRAGIASVKKRIGLGEPEVSEELGGGLAQWWEPRRVPIWHDVDGKSRPAWCGSTFPRAERDASPSWPWRRPARWG